MKNIREKSRVLRHIILLAFCFWATIMSANAQNIALKTNLLYWCTATPNIGAEFSFARKHSVQLFYGLNPWKTDEGKSLRHWVLQPEYRYWFCESLNGWFIGAHLMGGEFNVGNIDVPFNLFDDLKEHRYEGWYVGGGVSVGYQWMISRHWNFEASVGFGYDYIQYEKFKCGECGEKMNSSHAHYFGPTRAALSFLYVF